MSSLMGQALMGLGQTLPVWLVASFFWAFFVPLVNASNQAIWQAKVEADVQGRVFAARRAIAWLIMPVAQLIAGPLADHVFEPAMQPGGSLAATFGRLVGTGDGAGMGLIILLSGLAAAMGGVAGYAVRAVRNAEAILPDYDAQPGQVV